MKPQIYRLRCEQRFRPCYRKEQKNTEINRKKSLEKSEKKPSEKDGEKKIK